jgi:hypothetical protein
MSENVKFFIFGFIIISVEDVYELMFLFIFLQYFVRPGNRVFPRMFFFWRKMIKNVKFFFQKNNENGRKFSFFSFHLCYYAIE